MSQPTPNNRSRAGKPGRAKGLTRLAVWLFILVAALPFCAYLLLNRLTGNR